MDLYHHSNPLFTQWVVDEKLLARKFTVIDVGCQGGPHPRWQALGDYLDFHGFDPIEEVIDRLRAAHQSAANYRFYPLALGNEDGKREFYVRTDSFSSSFYAPQEPSLLQSVTGSDVRRGARAVEIRRLDTLGPQARIPSADYIKMDCEGFEDEVLRGAQNYLAASQPLCVTTETNFYTSPTHLRTHFGTLNDLLLPHGLRLFDLSYVRWPHPLYTAALPGAQSPLDAVRSLRVVGRPTTFDIVFCRDLVAERDWPDSYLATRNASAAPDIDTLIKAMINLELHGLMDCAVELAVQFREQLESRMDVSRALSLLLAPVPHARLDS